MMNSCFFDLSYVSDVLFVFWLDDYVFITSSLLITSIHLSLTIVLSVRNWRGQTDRYTVRVFDLYIYFKCRFLMLKDQFSIILVEKIKAVANQCRILIQRYFSRTFPSNWMIFRIQLFITVTNLSGLLNLTNNLQFLNYYYHIARVRQKFNESNCLQ